MAAPRTSPLFTYAISSLFAIASLSRFHLAVLSIPVSFLPLRSGRRLKICISFLSRRLCLAPPVWSDPFLLPTFPPLSFPSSHCFCSLWSLASPFFSLDDNLLKMAAVYDTEIYLAVPFCLHPFIFYLHHLPFLSAVSPTLSQRRGVSSLWGNFGGRQLMLQGFLILFSLCVSLSLSLSLCPLSCLSVSLFACMCLSVEFLAYVHTHILEHTHTHTHTHLAAAAASASLCTWLDFLPRADQLNWFHYLQTPLKEKQNWKGRG